MPPLRRWPNQMGGIPPFSDPDPPFPKLNCLYINSLNPNDALKHHFTSLKTDLIVLQLGVLEKKSHETSLTIHGNF